MKISIIGLARSGYAAALLAQSLGYTVKVSDAYKGAHMSPDTERVLRHHAEDLRARGIWVELGQHTRLSVDNADLVVVSPGVPDSAPPIVWAREQAIPVISEIEFAVRHTTARIVGITGTNGKTTTTSLIGHILDHACMPAIVAGNIGQALSSVVDNATANHTLVLEISSFQLETVRSFHPSIAVWLNLTPDHLDRYPSMAAYGAAKARMFDNMTPDDWAIIWHADRSIVEPYIERPKPRRVWIDETGAWTPTPTEPYGAICVNGELITIFNGIRQHHGLVSETQLVGPHNTVNMLAACATARILHVPQHMLAESLRTFKGLPHRLELVARDRGISFVNDSKATNVDAMIKALQTIPAPVALIAGGYDKGGDFAPVVPLVKERACKVVLIGKAKHKLATAFATVPNVVFAADMPEAVSLAALGALHGTTVLLAPGCASFDMYHDFEERGADFKSSVTSFLHTQA